MEVGIVSVVMMMSSGIRNLVFITASLIIFLISLSTGIQENEVQSFIFSDVLGNISSLCNVLCAG